MALQVEQDLVCSSGSANSLQAAYEAVADLINDARLTDDDRCWDHACCLHLLMHTRAPAEGRRPRIQRPGTIRVSSFSAVAWDTGTRNLSGPGNSGTPAVAGCGW